MVFEDTSALLIKNKPHIIKYSLKGVTFNGLVKMYTLPNFHTKDDHPDILVRGKININDIPRYKQIGFESKIQDGSINLCIFLQKLTYSQLTYKQSVNIFSTVEFVIFFNLEWKNSRNKKNTNAVE
jgi:hypothetical protein